MSTKQEKLNDAAPTVQIAKFMTGIAGEELLETDIAIPAAEPPPLAINEKLAVVGKPTPRLDGRLKVTGAARYSADVRLPGMLFARIVVSPVPHARVRSVDTTAAEKVTGVRAVHVLERVLGSAEVRDKSKELASSYPIVRYAGQPVAAVAATSQAAADEAARLVKVDYEPLPFVVDELRAREPGAPLVFPAPARYPRQKVRRCQHSKVKYAQSPTVLLPTVVASTTGLNLHRVASYWFCRQPHRLVLDHVAA